METLKFITIALLSLLLLKNLGIVEWDRGRPSANFDGTRENLVDAITGEPHDDY